MEPIKGGSIGLKPKKSIHTVPARITGMYRESYQVYGPEGFLPARVKGSLQYQLTGGSDYPTIGDYVSILPQPEGPALITEILPRRTQFSRSNFSGHAAGYAKTIREQVVAANFDYVFIFSSLNQDFNPQRILRYLTQARQSGGVPVVLLTKADLRPDASAEIAAVRALAPDIAVLAVSCQTGLGMEQLTPYLQKDKTLVLLGMSGVGKSSLLNALVGEERMTVRQIREDDSRGRHTTTHREMILLPCGAWIIDTPGMREMGLWNAEEGISQAFEAIETLAARCRFSDCHHGTEPGCAIRSALEEGTLSEKQWRDYEAQRQEMRFVQKRTKTPPPAGRRKGGPS